MMRRLKLCAMAGVVLAVAAIAAANTVTLQFNPNDIFNYATSDGTRLSQQGTARKMGD